MGRLSQLHGLLRIVRRMSGGETMRRFSAVLVILGMLTISTQRLLAHDFRQRSTWDDLSRAIPGMKIRLMLPDGTVLGGQALDVRPDELVIDVRRTSNPRRHARGRTGIPRSDVSAIELVLKRLPLGSSDAGAIGAGFGVAAVSPVLFYLGETNKISGWGALAIAIGAAAGGAIVASLVHGHPESVLITVVP
jgi:hypothetical protein